MLLGLGIAAMVVTVYGVFGVIYWVPGLALLLGNACGAYVGANCAVTKGSGWIRNRPLILVLMSALRLLV